MSKKRVSSYDDTLIRSFDRLKAIRRLWCIIEAEGHEQAKGAPTNVVCPWARRMAPQHGLEPRTQWLTETASEFPNLLKLL